MGLVFAALAARYVWDAPAQSAWGDGLMFIQTMAIGPDWDTNATSHLLYQNLGYTLTQLLPWGTHAGVLVALSVASALGALALAYRLSRDVAGRVSALFGTVVLGLAFTFWRHAVTIEVYALNLLVVTAMVLVAVRGIERRDGRHAIGLAALWGVSLLIHIQNVLLAPLALYYLWRTRPTPGRLAGAAAAWAVVVSPLVVLPLVLHTHPLRAVLFDSFEGEVLALDARTVVRGTALGIGYLLYNFHVWLVPIAVGAVRLWRTRPATARALALVAGTTWLFASRYPVRDSYVFFLTAYVCAAPCAAVGLDVLVRRMDARIRWALIAVAFVVAPALYASATAIARWTPIGQRIEWEKGYKGGVAFYLYPGMHGAPDPMDLARPDAPRPPGAPAPAWNVEVARRYEALLRQRTEASRPPR